MVASFSEIPHLGDDVAAGRQVGTPLERLANDLFGSAPRIDVSRVDERATPFHGGQDRLYANLEVHVRRADPGIWGLAGVHGSKPDNGDLETCPSQSFGSHDSFLFPFLMVPCPASLSYFGGPSGLRPSRHCSGRTS